MTTNSRTICGHCTTPAPDTCGCTAPAESDNDQCTCVRGGSSRPCSCSRPYRSAAIAVTASAGAGDLYARSVIAAGYSPPAALPTLTASAQRPGTLGPYLDPDATSITVRTSEKLADSKVRAEVENRVMASHSVSSLEYSLLAGISRALEPAVIDRTADPFRLAMESVTSTGADVAVAAAIADAVSPVIASAYAAGRRAAPPPPQPPRRTGDRFTLAHLSEVEHQAARGDIVATAGAVRQLLDRVEAAEDKYFADAFDRFAAELGRPVTAAADAPVTPPPTTISLAGIDADTARAVAAMVDAMKAGKSDQAMRGLRDVARAMREARTVAREFDALEDQVYGAQVGAQRRAARKAG